MKYYNRPMPGTVKLTDRFWTPYTEGIRDIMIPYCFEKFRETGYIKNFESVAKHLAFSMTSLKYLTLISSKRQIFL